MARVAKASGRPAGEVVRRLAGINNTNLQAMLKEIGHDLPKPQMAMLRGELEAAATRSYVPQLWSRPVEAALQQSAGGA